MKQAKTMSKSKQKTNRILSVLTLCTLAITAVIIGQFIVLDNQTNKTLQLIIGGQHYPATKMKKIHYKGTIVQYST